MSEQPVPTNVNKMINDLVHNRDGARQLVKEGGMPALFQKYQLTPQQMMAFKEPNWQSLGGIGIAPVHQILLALQISPEAKHHLSMSAFNERYQAEVLNQA